MPGWVLSVRVLAVLVVRSFRSQGFLAAVSAVLVVVAGSLVGVNVASADSLKHESYQRGSQGETCRAQVGKNSVAGLVGC